MIALCIYQVEFSDDNENHRLILLFSLGIVGLNNIKANDYCNVILQVSVCWESPFLEEDLFDL